MKVYVHGGGHLAKITREFLTAWNYEQGDPADIVWACEDVNGNQEEVLHGIHQLVDRNPQALCVVSSQLPVGTIRMLEKEHAGVAFACCPENFRLADGSGAYVGQARFVVGFRKESHRELLRGLFNFAPVTWMSIESAEMVKHTVNAYLGMCITFINEIRDICNAVGADIDAVERGLRSEERVSPNAPLHAGDPFGGGHIDRDLNYLREIHRTPLIEAIYESNHSRRR